jgi:hypothetical protein
MMVDSSATTGAPASSACSTCGAISIEPASGE